MANAGLTPEQVEQTCAAVLRNTNDLLGDAATLFKEKRFARSFFLAGLALEEAAKIPLLTLASDWAERGENVDWRGIRRFAHTHPQKLTNLAMIFWVGQIMAGEFVADSTLVTWLERITNEWMAKRNAALYVDPFSEDRGTTPAEQVTEREAGMLLLLGAYVTDTLESMLPTAEQIRANAAEPTRDFGSFEKLYAELAEQHAREERGASDAGRGEEDSVT